MFADGSLDARFWHRARRPVVALVLVTLVAGTVIWVLRSDDVRSARAAAPVTEPASESSTPSRAPTAPAASPTQPRDRARPFSYVERSDTWVFSIGEDTLVYRARFVRGWDDDTCHEVEVGTGLTDLGCRRASEWTLRARNDRLAMSHLVLTFRTDRAAQQAVASLATPPIRFQFRSESLLGGQRSAGTYAINFVRFRPYVVITLETHAPSITQQSADTYTRLGTADVVDALDYRY